jgi:hypothetical protein
MIFLASRSALSTSFGSSICNSVLKQTSTSCHQVAVYCLLLYLSLASTLNNLALSQTRISRPNQLTKSPTNDGAASSSTNQTELNAGGTPAVLGAYFQGIRPGMSVRWWRKFRNPAFCPFIICNGSCTDISGQPRIGSYSSEDLVSDLTPCSLSSEWIDPESSACCMSRTIKKTYDAECKDGCCNTGMGK